jgi:hypothetical protein
MRVYSRLWNIPQTNWARNARLRHYFIVQSSATAEVFGLFDQISRIEAVENQPFDQSRLNE